MTVSDTVGQTCALEVDVTVMNADGGVPDAAWPDASRDADVVSDAREDTRDSAADGSGPDAARDVAQDGARDADASMRDVARIDVADAGARGADVANSDASTGGPDEAAGGSGCSCDVARTRGDGAPSFVGLSALLFFHALRHRRRGPATSRNAV
jgi:hypothetical protein